jgi:hypothetical protein
LRNGDHVNTPLLVPSLSSKGFPFLTTKDRKASEAEVFLRIAAPGLNESLLISAYDIRQGHLPDVAQFSDGFLQSIYSNPKLLIIDSGGYEKSRDYDSGSVYRYPVKSEPWGPGKLAETLSSFSPEVTGAIVNFDGKGSYERQISDAQAFLSRWPRFLAVCLVKPEPRAQYLNVDKLRPLLPRLHAFSAVGVTEKELGSSVLDRALAIAKLRGALDQGGVDIPIHVFGSLDTLFTPLYFLVGAEIFDGLTWLRYAYRDGATVYPDALALMEGDLSLRDDQRVARMVVHNLDYLGRLKLQMRRYVRERDMSVFGKAIATALQQALSSVEAELGGNSA